MCKIRTHGRKSKKRRTLLEEASRSTFLLQRQKENCMYWSYSSVVVTVVMLKDNLKYY